MSSISGVIVAIEIYREGVAIQIDPGNDRDVVTIAAPHVVNRYAPSRYVASGYGAEFAENCVVIDAFDCDDGVEEMAPTLDIELGENGLDLFSAEDAVLYESEVLERAQVWVDAPVEQARGILEELYRDQVAERAPGDFGPLDVVGVGPFLRWWRLRGARIGTVDAVNDRIRWENEDAPSD